jgi:hypothetical protein
MGKKIEIKYLFVTHEVELMVDNESEGDFSMIVRTVISKEKVS